MQAMEWCPLRDHDGSDFDNGFELATAGNPCDAHCLPVEAIAELLDVDDYHAWSLRRFRVARENEMDPKATLIALLEAIAEGDTAEILAMAEAMADWREKGGYVPDELYTVLAAVRAPDLGDVDYDSVGDPA